MYKKMLVIFAILTIGIFSFSVCFANNDGSMLQDAANGVRDAVGGAENAIEDGAKDIANTTKGVTGSAENAMENKDNSGMTQNNNRTNNSNYIATRTATTNSTFMGMSSTAWTWLIIGIAGIAIVALVWYYGSQIRTSNDD
mgnify:FL=1